MGGAICLYKRALHHRISGQIRLKRRASTPTKRVVQHHGAAGNAVLIPVSQGTEVTLVTVYVPFRYYTCTALLDAYGEPIQSCRAMKEERLA